MATYSTNQFKPGLKLMFDGDPYTIIDNEFVKPGKGQAFNRIKIRNLKTGRTIEKTMKSGDTAEGADVVDLELQFLYTDGEEYHFMNTQTFDQLIAPASAMADAAKWLKGQEMCQVTLWNDAPLNVSPPNFVVLRITATDPGLNQVVSQLESRHVERRAGVLNPGRTGKQSIPAITDSGGASFSNLFVRANRGQRPQERISGPDRTRFRGG